MNKNGVNKLIFFPNTSAIPTIDAPGIDYSKIAEFLEIVIEQGNVCMVKYGDLGEIIVEYAPSSPLTPMPYPYWLDPAEAAYAEEYHKLKEYSEKVSEISQYENDPTNQAYLKEAQELVTLFLQKRGINIKDTDESKDTVEENKNDDDNGGFKA